MNPILLTIIIVPVIEIYLLIKIGSQVGAITTIFLIFTTAIIGVYYAKYEGLNTLKSGFDQLSRNETPAYEVVSGAAIAFAALLLIVPGFVTDILGFLLIFPLSRKLIDNVPIKEKKERLSQVDSIQKDIVTTINAKLLDTTQEVLVEKFENDQWQGRNRNDKLVFFESKNDENLIGKTVVLSIDKTSPWYLHATEKINA